MRMGMREGVSKEGDIFICLMEWALLRAEHLSNRQTARQAKSEAKLRHPGIQPEMTTYTDTPSIVTITV